MNAVVAADLIGYNERVVRVCCFSLVVGLLLASVIVGLPSAHAVLFKSSADPSYNSTSPGGSLTNSGWQWEGEWEGSYLGTAISPRHFITASHFGGNVGDQFLLNGFYFHTTAVYDDPSSDLRIWQVAETFPTNALLYTKNSEVGKHCAVFGRGLQRGPAVIVSGVTNGWQWGAGDSLKRWAENDVATTIDGGAGLGVFLQMNFDRSGGANECQLTVGDSGGAVFIQDGSVWKLAGIHYSVSDSFISTNGVNGSGFNAAMLDYGGVYRGGDGNWTLVANQQADIPASFYSTRISAHVAWINSVITSVDPNPPAASFSATPTSGTRPLTVTFTDYSTGTLTNRFWDFGDGTTTNTSANILTHTYNTAGTRTVTLIVRGSAGVSTNVQDNLIVVTNPAQLSVAPASLNFGSVTVGLTSNRTFTVTNTGDLPLSGNATVGGAFAISAGSTLNVNPGQMQTVTVTFQPGGAGTSSNIVVFSSNGGNSTNAVTGTGLTAGQLAVSPVALDFGTVATGSTSQRVFVVSNTGGTAVSNGTATVIAPFMIVSGQQFSVPAFGSTNVVVKFAPSATGAVTNQVVFASANGGSPTNSVTGTGVIAPVAGFTFSPTNGLAPLLVNFIDASTGTITNRLWNFGDTFTSTQINPSHTYSNAGVYLANLTVYGTVGSNSTAGVAITVTNLITPPVASFTANPTNGAAPLMVVFNDTSTGTVTNQLWNFGDAGTSGGISPAHTYTNAGAFTVSLSVFGPGGMDTSTQPGLITVTNVLPQAGFTAAPTNGVAPLLVNFADASTGTITNRLWNFGDGSGGAALNPSHTYTNAGSFSVVLTVFGPTGTDVLSQPNLIVVAPAPLPADLAVIKLASPSPVSVASNLTYTITVTNHGPATATSITLTDSLPASVNFVSVSDECTNTAGIVVCDLGSLAGGEATNVTVVVVPTVEGALTNVASVFAAEVDSNPTNNTATAVTQVFTIPPPPHDLAVVKLKAPKKITLSAKTTSKVGKFKVTIQNLGPQTESIPNLTALTGLVTVEVETLGTNCANFTAALVPPKKSLPTSLAPNKKLNLSYRATFDCANDPAATTKTAAHNDFKAIAAVDLGALGEVDAASANDLCPRPPSGSDAGCGNKTSSGALGADVFIEVVVKP